MSGRPSPRASGVPSVVVAGHICIDVIPELPPDPRRLALRPGALDIVGPAALAVGGCVGNTGIALHRLGLRTTLVARVGDDPLGIVLGGLVREAVPPADARLIATAGAATSYSLVLNRPGQDRAIAHFPGVNDRFVASDVVGEVLRGATLLHVGYPPLMAAMVADGGRELATLLERARSLGVATSVDMANPSLAPGGDRAGWRRVLERTLPSVDVFLPSLAEASQMLRRRVGSDEDGRPRLADVARIADELIGIGVAIAGVKLGEHGLYVRGASSGRAAAVPGGLAVRWADRELHSTVFEARVVGTTGAGDATIAGFLFGLVTGQPPAAAMETACAVGGSSTEAPDGTSAIAAWAVIEQRLLDGWRRVPAAPSPGWITDDEVGLSRGPRDAGR
jgi:sugar/nucleoside kinase (ribokinase family)